MMKYTKGPWEVIHEFNVQQTGTRRGIASCGNYTSNSKGRETIYDENIANAQLIAAAPDMYEALKGIQSCKRISKMLERIIIMKHIEQAIAKAEGK